MEIRPRSVSNDKFLSSVNLQFPIQIAGGKYVDLSRSYFEFDLDLSVLPATKTSTDDLETLGFTNVFSNAAVSASGDDVAVAAGDGACGLDRAWWANWLSAVRHKVNGNTICSSNDVVLSTIAAMQSHTSDYNENQGSAFCYQTNDVARQDAAISNFQYRTAMRPLNSMNCKTLVPGSVSQQIELDFKQFSLYKENIFKITGNANQLKTSALYDSDKVKAAFGHISEQDDVPTGGLAHDKVFFAIRDIRLMVCTVADKMNRAIPQSILLEWEYHDIKRVTTENSAINSQVDIQHGHKVSIFSQSDQHNWQSLPHNSSTQYTRACKGN